MAGLEPWISGVGSDRAANFATTTIFKNFIFWCTNSNLKRSSKKAIKNFDSRGQINQILLSYSLFFKWAIPGLFFVYFRLYEHHNVYNK